MEILGPIIDKIRPNHTLSQRRLRREVGHLVDRWEKLFDHTHSPLLSGSHYDHQSNTITNQTTVADSLGGRLPVQYTHESHYKPDEGTMPSSEDIYVNVQRQNPIARNDPTAKIVNGYLSVTKQRMTFLGRDFWFGQLLPTKVTEARISTFLYSPDGINHFNFNDAESLKYMRRLVLDAEKEYPLKDYVV